MSTSKVSTPAKAPAVQGTLVAQLGADFALVRTNKTKAKPKGETSPTDRASTLVGKASRALAKPGLPKSSVFTGSKGVYAFSVDSNDPTQLIRETPAGLRQAGRMVNGRFLAAKR